MPLSPISRLWHALIAAPSYLAGLGEAAVILRAHQTSLRDHHRFVQQILRSPSYIGMVALIPLLVASGMTGLPFRNLSTLANTAIIGVAALILVACTYLWLGRWFYEGVRRNIPYIWVDCAFYSVAHVIYHLIFGPLVFDASFDRAIERFSNTYPGALVLTALTMAYFVADARKRLSREPGLVPVFWPISRDAALRIARLGTEANAEIFYLQSENKGTLVVSDQGKTLLRRPLADVIEDLPLPKGLRCHRSLWVAAAQVQDVIYTNGNPQVVLISGAVFPISRASVATLRDMAKAGAAGAGR